MTIISVPVDYASISAAILAAEDGDEIQIAYGEYFENLNINKDNLAIIGIPSELGEFPIVTMPGEVPAEFVKDEVSYIFLMQDTSSVEIANLKFSSPLVGSGAGYIYGCTRFDIHNIEVADGEFDYGLTLACGEITNSNFRIDSCVIDAALVGIDDKYSTTGSVQVTSCIFSGCENGVGFAPPLIPPVSIDYAPMPGGYTIPDISANSACLYFVVKNKFISPARFSVEGAETEKTNFSEVVAYKNIFENVDNPVYFSETTVSTRLYSPARERYCISGTPYLSLLGNYWGGYTAPVESNGIWGNPFIVSQNHYDNYPLVGKWGPDFISEGYYSTCVPARGTIYDDSAIKIEGELVLLSGATVVITGKDDGVEYSRQITGADGLYSIPGENMPVGITLIAQCAKTGYITEQKEITVNPEGGSQIVLDFHMWTVHLYGR